MHDYINIDVYVYICTYAHGWMIRVAYKLRPRRLTMAVQQQNILEPNSCSVFKSGCLSWILVYAESSRSKLQHQWGNEFARESESKQAKSRKTPSSCHFYMLSPKDLAKLKVYLPTTMYLDFKRLFPFELAEPIS